MKKYNSFFENIASGQEITTKERRHGFSKVVFLLPEVCLLKGVLHSSSQADYIEPKKSGGQSTDCLKKWLCADQTIITGLAEMNKQMLKTVIKSRLIGTLER